MFNRVSKQEKNYWNDHEKLEKRIKEYKLAVKSLEALIQRNITVGYLSDEDAESQYYALKSRLDIKNELLVNAREALKKLDEFGKLQGYKKPKRSRTNKRGRVKAKKQG